LPLALGALALVGVAAAVYIIAESSTKTAPVVHTGPVAPTPSPLAQKISRPDTPTPAPDYAFKDATGRDLKVADFKGKVVVLNTWATWCGPCKVEIPHFIEFQQKYGAKGLQVVGISVDDPVDKLVPYVKEMGMNYPVLQGLGHDAVQDAYGPILGIPVSVMISRDGKVCATHTGLTGKDVFEQEIQSLL